MHQMDLRDHTELTDDEHAQSLAWIEALDDPVVALARMYPAGLQVPSHSHTKTQLWFARSGVVLIMTSSGRWMVPPGHGLLIPAGVEHSTEMISEVRMQSIYLDQAVINAEHPRVLEVTALAGSLIEELVRPEEAQGSKRRRLIMELLLDEVGRLPAKPLGLPLPGDARLRRLCRRFLTAPSANAGIDDWANTLGMSRRSFTRLFRNETGLSFVTWRQQACLFASLPRLAAGVSVTNVAFDAGYQSMAAFTTMFHRMLGSAPSAYLRSHKE